MGYIKAFIPCLKIKHGINKKKRWKKNWFAKNKLFLRKSLQKENFELLKLEFLQKGLMLQ
jgi:hypothetical protein